MTKTLAGLLREFNVTVIPISRNHRRAARETCADKTLAHIFQLYGYNHTRMVVMSIVESKPNKRALISPVVRGGVGCPRGLSSLVRRHVVSGF
jgi:hypothetical protein